VATKGCLPCGLAIIDALMLNMFHHSLLLLVVNICLLYSLKCSEVDNRNSPYSARKILVNVLPSRSSRIDIVKRDLLLAGNTIANLSQAALGF
jgi:hypothetical protein